MNHLEWASGAKPTCTASPLAFTNMGKWSPSSASGGSAITLGDTGKRTFIKGGTFVICDLAAVGATNKVLISTNTGTTKPAAQLAAGTVVTSPAASPYAGTTAGTAITFKVSAKTYIYSVMAGATADADLSCSVTAQSVVIDVFDAATTFGTGMHHIVSCAAGDFAGTAKYGANGWTCGAAEIPSSTSTGVFSKVSVSPNGGAWGFGKGATGGGDAGVSCYIGQSCSIALQETISMITGNWPAAYITKMEVYKTAPTNAADGVLVTATEADACTTAGATGYGVIVAGTGALPSTTATTTICFKPKVAGTLYLGFRDAQASGAQLGKHHAATIKIAISAAPVPAPVASPAGLAIPSVLAVVVGALIALFL